MLCRHAAAAPAGHLGRLEPSRLSDLRADPPQLVLGRPLSLAWTLAPIARDFLEIFGLKVSSGSLSGVSFFSLYSRV